MELELATIDDIIAELEKRPNFNYVVLAWDNTTDPNWIFSASPHLTGPEVIETLRNGLGYACYITDELGD